MSNMVEATPAESLLNLCLGQNNQPWFFLFVTNHARRQHIPHHSRYPDRPGGCLCILYAGMLRFRILAAPVKAGEIERDFKSPCVPLEKSIPLTPFLCQRKGEKIEKRGWRPPNREISSPRFYYGYLGKT